MPSRGPTSSTSTTRWIPSDRARRPARGTGSIVRLRCPLPCAGGGARPSRGRPRGHHPVLALPARSEGLGRLVRRLRGAPGAAARRAGARADARVDEAHGRPRDLLQRAIDGPLPQAGLGGILRHPAALLLPRAIEPSQRAQTASRSRSGGGGGGAERRGSSVAEPLVPSAVEARGAAGRGAGQRDAPRALPVESPIRRRADPRPGLSVLAISRVAIPIRVSRGALGRPPA